MSQSILSPGITRSSFRNMSLLLIALLLSLMMLIFNWAQGEAESITQKTYQLTDLSNELENAARRSAALDELDKLTIDEKTATRLDILRHLGLEQTNYTFSVNARNDRTIADANLYTRMVQMEAQLPYGDALDLIDRLHETRKIVITRIQLERSTQTGDKVMLSLEGTIYGLEKQHAE
jgi:hypothetical protein